MKSIRTKIAVILSTRFTVNVLCLLLALTLLPDCPSTANSRAGVLKPLEDITYNKTVKWVELELRDFCECYLKRGIADVIKMMCKLQGCQMKI